MIRVQTTPEPKIDRVEHTPPTGVRWHEYADLFPWIEGQAREELKADIAKNGVLEPVVFLGGAILDGRNRYTIARELGIEYPRVEYTGDDPLAFVLAKNLSRRHLTDRQRADVAAKIAKLPKGANQHTPIGGPSIAAAAKLMDVPVKAVERAKAIQEYAAPELKQAYEAGQVSQSAAAELAKLPAEEQVKVVAEGKAAEAAKQVREQRKAEQPVPTKRTAVPIAEFEAVEAERDELREENAALRADVERLTAEVAKFADLKMEYDRGGFEEVIKGKDEVIAAQATRIERESADKASWKRSSDMWRKRAEEAGWSNDVVIDLEDA